MKSKVNLVVCCDYAGTKDCCCLLSADALRGISLESDAHVTGRYDDVLLEQMGHKTCGRDAWHDCRLPF